MIFPSGSSYCFQDKCGIYFWGIHSHDTIWHLALIETAFKRIPFISPTFSGVALTGYNYLYDLVVFALAKIGISPLFSVFKLIPFFWFIGFTVLLIKLAKKIKNNPLFISLFLFFTFFTGSFSYFFTLYRDKTIIGSYGMLSQLPMHLMLNFQFALSLIGILYILIKTKSKEITLKNIIAFGLIVFINLSLKFYGGVVTLILVGWFLFFKYLLKNIKKLIFYEAIITIFFITSLIIFYNPFASVKSGSIFTIAPFALVHPITEDPSLFYLQNLTNARYFLLTKGIGPRLIMIEAFNLIIFLFFYLGMRFFGLFYILLKVIKRKITQFDLVVVSTMITATTITVLIVQKAEWWNTIQFFYYAVFLSTIYLAELTYELIKKTKFIRYVLVVIIMLLAIPATIDITQWSMSFPGDSYLSKDEYEALQILKKQPEGVVYSPLFEKSLKNLNLYPFPLYSNGDTAYVTAFSGKQSYLSDILQLRLTGVDYNQRLEKIQNNDCSLLKEVDYLYQNNEYKINRKLFNCENRLEMLYGNRTATIYKVIK